MYLSRTQKLWEHSRLAKLVAQLKGCWSQSFWYRGLTHSAECWSQKFYPKELSEVGLIMVISCLPLIEHSLLLLVVLFLTSLTHPKVNDSFPSELLWLGLVATLAAFFSPGFLPGLVALQEFWFGLGIAYWASRVFQPALVARLMKALVGISCFWLFLGYQQYFAKIPIPSGWVEAGQLEEIGTRIYAIFGNPNVYGIYLLTLLVMLKDLFSKSSRAVGKIFYAMLILAVLGALYLTYSRIAWLVALGCLIIWSWSGLGRRRWWYYSLGLLCLINLSGFQVRLGSLINLTESTLGYRLQIWRGTWQVISKNWFWGSGPGSFRLVYPESGGVFALHAHQFYLQLWLESGLVTLVVWGCLLGRSLLRMKASWLGKTFALLILVFLLAGLSESWSESTFLRSYFWLLLGIGRALPTMERTE